MSVGRVDVRQQLVEGGVVVQRRRGVDAVGRVGNTQQDELGSGRRAVTSAAAASWA